MSPINEFRIFFAGFLSLVVLSCTESTDTSKYRYYCEKDSECMSGYICKNNVCVSKSEVSDVGETECKIDIDCPEGRSCREGKCVVIETEDASSDIVSQDIIDEDYLLEDRVFEDNPDVESFEDIIIEDAGIDEFVDVSKDVGCKDECQPMGKLECVDNETYRECIKGENGCLILSDKNYCSKPPRNYCVDSKYVRIYDTTGKCTNDRCEYSYTDKECASGCENGVCKNCTPDCANRECGDDGCGGSCGSCSNVPVDYCIDSSTLRDYNGANICQNYKCTYNYTDVKCTYGCLNGSCKSCTPNCTNKECGDDGCGGKCPPGCKAGENCVYGKCVSNCPYTKYGWDFNLTKRCAKSVCDSSSEYYYEDTTECNSNSSWLIAVESEATLGASCPGPVNCSFRINGPDSPVNLEWIPHSNNCGSNYAVHMLVDHSAHPSPCQGDYFTWFAFMDHTQNGGGPYPPISKAVSHHIINFTDFTPYNDSAARVFVGGQWWYNGKARMIELNLVLTQWGDADPHPALIVRFDTPEFEFVALDAKYWGLDIPKGVDTEVNIHWIQILQEVVKNGWFADPGSWDNVGTTAYFIGMEVKNKGIGSLWHTDFMITE